MIDTMLAKQQITAASYIPLNYYRGQAIDADRSPIKSNIDFKGGSGNARPIGYETPQQMETGRIERDLGALRDIVRAIAVDDYSISEWCVKTYGGKEVTRGKRVSIEPRRKHINLSLLELADGASRIKI
jgi:hypothetical protein